MPAIGAALVFAFQWLIRTQIGRILLLGMAWFGVNYVTLKVVLDPAIEVLQGTMNGASGGTGLVHTMWEWMLVLKFPGALNMVVSAFVTRVAINGTKPFFQKVAS